MKAPDILKAAAGHMEDRAATYDKPEGERSMGATVGAFQCVTGHALTEEQGWLFMQILKAVRSQQGDYRADSYEDGAAYASLAGEAAYRERCANKPANPFHDTVLDLDAAWTEGEERMRNIASSHGDGEHYAEDMNNPANWRAGDLVERITDETEHVYKQGNIYEVKEVTNDIVRIYDEFRDDDDKESCCAMTPHDVRQGFRFHSRPSQVNEQEMSGIWHHWSGGECPCDELSFVEIERRNGFKIQSGAASFDWFHKNVPGDIIRYRML